MAKKMVFELVKGQFEIVQSAIYTLKLDVAGEATPREIDRAVLIDAKNPVKGDGTNNYRFKSVVAVPYSPIKSDMSNADLQASMGELAAAIDLYDNSEQIKTSDGRLIDRKITIVPRGKDGNPIMSTAAYLATLAHDALRLAVQKDLQKPLRDLAENTVRGELSLVAPASKPKKVKSTDGTPYNPESELS